MGNFRQINIQVQRQMHTSTQRFHNDFEHFHHGFGCGATDTWYIARYVKPEKVLTLTQCLHGYMKSYCAYVNLTTRSIRFSDKGDYGIRGRLPSPVARKRDIKRNFPWLDDDQSALEYGNMHFIITDDRLKSLSLIRQYFELIDRINAHIRASASSRHKLHERKEEEKKWNSTAGDRRQRNM